MLSRNGPGTGFVVSDLVRNPRRTLSAMVGVTLGVGVFCGVLFFVDGLSASMTQRAVAPLAIDMQRIVTDGVGGSVLLTQTVDPAGPVAAGDRIRVSLGISNSADVAANEVTIRSVPAGHLEYVSDSARLDGEPMGGGDDNPLAQGAGRTGLNIGTLPPDGTRHLSYLLEATRSDDVDEASVRSTYSTRESVAPTEADRPPPVGLEELATMISEVDGVASASPLSIGDLGLDAISANGAPAPGTTKIFGFDAAYDAGDPTIEITEGELSPSGVVLSAETALATGADVGDAATVALPDGSSIEMEISGTADLSRSRSLFSSRRGGDLETFVYAPNSAIVSPIVFADTVAPAYERAATARGGRLKSPPIFEVDVSVERDLLASDPATAVDQTERIAADVASVAAHQDYMLDNISNALTVATADADAAKRLFVFLGVPGGVLAAMLAAYAGTVLAEAQRREQAVLRVRGAGRRHLLRMLALRTGLLTAVGSIGGLAIGYVAARAVLGSGSLERASTGSLVRSALIGTLGGLVATGSALYVSGRRSIDREIDEDRARLSIRPPLWRRARLDLIAIAVVALGTALALRSGAFDGASGSVYFGRAVELNLALLVLPTAVWIAGSLLAARLVGAGLARSRPRSSPTIGHPLTGLYRLSVGRRPWAIGNGAIVVSLIVALATCLTAFTASYDAAKVDDARFANGADIRITPSPTAERRYSATDGPLFETDGVASSTPIVYGLSNVILRSARTSDPANLAAIDPAAWSTIAPVADSDFAEGDAHGALDRLESDPTAIFVSSDMAAFLKASVGDRLEVLLARATDQQTRVELRIAGLFERLPGFPDGADALMSIGTHTRHVPGKPPDFFLASAADGGDEGLRRAVDSLSAGPGTTDRIKIDTRSTMLARDQSSLAALNIAGLVQLDSAFSLSMATVTIAIFVFGLLLQRRREYTTLRAQGLESGAIRLLIAAEAGTVAVAGIVAGLVVGAAMGFYFVTVLRPLFVLTPGYTLPIGSLVTPVALVLVATFVSSVGASRLVERLDPTELLKDE